jgi:hypothetical protein
VVSAVRAYAGCQVMSIDGSTLPVPDERANAQTLGLSGRPTYEADRSRIRLVALAERAARAVSGRSVYAMWRLISEVARAASRSFSFRSFLCILKCCLPEAAVWTRRRDDRRRPNKGVTPEIL